jgi:hypothetical protein
MIASLALGRQITLYALDNRRSGEIRGLLHQRQAVAFDHLFLSLISTVMVVGNSIGHTGNGLHQCESHN